MLNPSALLRSLALVALLGSFSTVAAQDRVPREQCLKIACQLSLDLKRMLNTPIPTDPDIKHAVAAARDNRGAMVLPETRLSAQVLAGAGNDPVSIGQLWLHKIAVLRDGQPVPAGELQLVTVEADGQTRTAALCALAVRKNAEGKLELLIYGKDKKPLLAAPLKEKDAATQQEDPIEISAVAQDNGAVVTLDIAGRYQASFTVGASE